MLELLLAGTVFMVFISQIGSTWASFGRSMKYLSNRALLAREIRVARAVMVSDLAMVSNVTLVAPDKMRLHYPGPASPDIIYWNREGTLVRKEQTTDWVMPVARYLNQSDFLLQADGSVQAVLVFRKGISQSTLNVFMNIPKKEKKGKGKGKK